MQMNLHQRLEEIKKRADAATPGPWVTYRKSLLGKTKADVGSWVSNAPINKEADRTFIAYARTDVPRLLDVINFMLRIFPNQMVEINLGKKRQLLTLHEAIEAILNGKV